MLYVAEFVLWLFLNFWMKEGAKKGEVQFIMSKPIIHVWDEIASYYKICIKRLSQNAVQVSAVWVPRPAHQTADSGPADGDDPPDFS